MKKQNLTIRILCAGLALSFGLIASAFLNTTRVNEMKSETQSVDLESASTAKVQLNSLPGN